MSKLDMTLAQVRDLIGAGEILGDPEFRCASVASLDLAGPDQLSFVRDKRYLAKALASAAGALVVPYELEGVAAHQLVVDEPFQAFGMVLTHIAAEKRRHTPGVDPRAHLADDVELGTDVTVGAGAVLDAGAKIGDRTVVYPNAYVGRRNVVGADCVIHPGVVLMEDVTLGDRVIIHGGTVIGADGYGYLQHEGKHHKIPQIGAVRIDDDVEIGAATTIDRSALDTTVIGRGSKVGDNTHIGHNSVVGEDVLVFPTTAISGSVKIGNNVIFAGRSGAYDGVTVGEGAVLGGTAVAMKDVAPGAVLWGNPARDKVEQMRIVATLPALPKMKRRLAELEKKLEERS